ncbi:MAG: septal ring lytic transglycosylase RlpA family protein [Candidatus Omnitrophica bacterium]|nr:septal ring lytic transglycosylase RlpA family protein [Candidatus Omnitrophota bacterium]
MSYEHLQNLSQWRKTQHEEHNLVITLVLAISILAILMVIFLDLAHAQTLTASWYSVASCKREGTWQKYGGRMANGQIFNDNALTCASWDYKFGTRLLVKNIDNGKKVVVIVTDRGPSKKLAKKGRIIDLSKGAFSKISNLKSGIISIEIEVLS